MSDATSIPIRHVADPPTPNSARYRGRVNTPSYEILVPIPGDENIDFDPLNIPRLLQTPLAVAKDHDGSVTVASILVAPSDVELGDFENSERDPMAPVIEAAQQELAAFLEVANEIGEDVHVHGFVGVVDTPEAAFGEFTTSDQYDAIFLAQTDVDSVQLWEEPRIRSVLDTANCAVYVENIGSEEDLVLQFSSESTIPHDEVAADQPTEILLAVGTGPHSVLCAETARAVAKASGASVHALHLISYSDDGQTRQEGREALSLAEYVLSDLPDVECEAREVEAPIDELITEIDQYDLSIVGAPTESSLLSRLFTRSMPEKVMTQSTTSVITVRQPSEAMDSIYYRWKRAVERTTDVDLPPAEECGER